MNPGGPAEAAVRRRTTTPLPAVARFGAVIWPSFFAAGVATTVFFAIVDPVELAQITWPHITITRELGYTIGFFMFWACTFAACLFTALLLSAPDEGIGNSSNKS